MNNLGKLILFKIMVVIKKDDLFMVFCCSIYLNIIYNVLIDKNK